MRILVTPLRFRANGVLKYYTKYLQAIACLHVSTLFFIIDCVNYAFHSTLGLYGTIIFLHYALGGSAQTLASTGS